MKIFAAIFGIAKVFSNPIAPCQAEMDQCLLDFMTGGCMAFPYCDEAGNYFQGTLFIFLNLSRIF